MKKKVCILTLGCPKNITDTEYVISSLPKDNFIFVQDVMKANIILLNTCGFISASIDESYNYIKVLSELKQKKTTLQIIVFGCLVSRFGVNKLKKKFPLVDAFYPILSSGELLNHFNTKLDYIRQTLITPFHYSYLKISDGCNRGCAFCTIPLIKGKYKSVSSAQLLKEAKSLVKKGVKELILIGQETTNYGQDNSNKYDFVSLLDDISKIENVEWIRIMYTHPNSFNNKILNLMKSRRNICHYIDMPLQHISDNVLDKMQRGTSSTKIKYLINSIRDTIPNIAIRSTFIVGYPGETDKDFNMLYDFLAEYKLNRVGIFKYSKEANTIGAKLPLQIPEKIKQFRFDKLMQLQQKISLENNKKFIKTKMKVLIDDIKQENNKKILIARTEFDCPEIDNSVIIDANKNTKNNSYNIGDFIEVSIKKATEYDLFA